MGHLKADNGNAYAPARNSLFHGFGYLFGKQVHFCQQVVVHVKNVVNLLFRDYQRVAFCQGLYIQKGKAVVGFRYLMAGNLAVYNACKDGGHAYDISSISNTASPAGVLTLAVSPTFLPRIPCATGELTEILPSFRLASFSATMV